MDNSIVVQPLTAAGFAPFGTVIEAPESEGESANSGTARRWRNVTQLELGACGGTSEVSIFRADPISLPYHCNRLERHPFSSQMFIPLGAHPFLVLVADGDGPAPSTERLRAFRTNGAQGVNYRRGVWHHPLLALHCTTTFVMVGRTGPGRDFELAEFAEQTSVCIRTF